MPEYVLKEVLKQGFSARKLFPFFTSYINSYPYPSSRLANGITWP